MPGLSTNPEAAKRQLDALKRGREAQARALLADELEQRKAGARAKPRQSPGTSPGKKPGQRRAYAKPAKPKPPKKKESDARRANGGGPAEPEPEGRAGGPLARFAEGFLGG